MQQQQQQQLRIAIIGGGPTALLMFKRLTDADKHRFSIHIFERKQLLGAGMPYSRDGACDEHITNVSGNEIPELYSTVEEWIQTEHKDTLHRFHIEAENFNDYKVLPRLLFGRYLSEQFQALIAAAKEKGFDVNVHYRAEVTDIVDNKDNETVCVKYSGGQLVFDRVIICSGHHWPKKHEGNVKGYFDSPYPPEKLTIRTNHAVAIRGSSLTAIDAIRTLARSNGKFSKENGRISYSTDPESRNFRMVMHSRNGLLPAVRFHLEDSHLSKDAVLSIEEVREVMNGHNGFLPLDYVYKKNFLEPLALANPRFHATIADLSIEEFVDEMMKVRESKPAFELLADEITEAEKSIRNKSSVNWKEMLAVLSFAMNYPAKHFSAEDMQRLKKTLMPLISVVIAFAPQGSIYEMMALHQAGVLDIVSVGEDSEIEIQDNGGIRYHYRDKDNHEVAESYQTFVDAIGQPHLQMKDIPYPSLISLHNVSPALLRFADQELAAKTAEKGDEQVIKLSDGLYYQKVPGVAINDNFQLLDTYGAANERIYMLAVPYIGGYNPDYSGLDFGEEASKKVAACIHDIGITS